MFYILACPEPEDLQVAQVTYLPDDLDLDWATGARMPQQLELPVQASVEPDGDGDFIDLIEVPLPLMSRRLAESMRAAGVDNIEFFPCSITIESTGEIVDHMLAFNIVGVVSCADTDKSSFEDEGGMGVISLVFDRLVLDPQRAEGLKIFRLAEFTPAIVVHDSLRRFLEARGFEDLQFIEPADWAS